MSEEWKKKMKEINEILLLLCIEAYVCGLVMKEIMSLIQYNLFVWRKMAYYS